MKSILKLSATEARQNLLKASSYCTFELPQYFNFQPILDAINKVLKDKGLPEYYAYQKHKNVKTTSPILPSQVENVNYKFITNKDGRFAWRPFELIHPALYVSLVHKVTTPAHWNKIKKQFATWYNNTNIQCLSMPIMSENDQSDKAAGVLNWWQDVEQHSLKLSIAFGYVINTDITDCYGSIDAYSIFQALHSRKPGKDDKRYKNSIGNIIKQHIENMHYGQTKGIPQGSTLMNLIAEIVLSHADSQLSRKIQLSGIKDYRILRYRDDYRIFTNSANDAEIILKHLSDILRDLGMSLNTSKTSGSSDIMQSSIKPDKLYCIANKNNCENIQHQLLYIQYLSQRFPNSGSLVKELNKFLKRIIRTQKKIPNVPVLISIVVEIGNRNPRSYPLVAAILSKLVSLFDIEQEKKRILESIIERFRQVSNSGHLQVWMQRITIKDDKQLYFDEPLCQMLLNPNFRVWNSNWLNSKLKIILKTVPIIDHNAIEKMPAVISLKEVELFCKTYEYQ